MVLGEVSVVAKGVSTDYSWSVFHFHAVSIPEHVPLSALVFVYGGVMMQVGQMAHNGSFIKLEEGTEVCYIMKVLLLF